MRREGGRGFGQHGQAEAQEAVGAHLEQHTGEDDGPGGRRLHMRVGQPGVDGPHRDLHGEGGEEGEEQPELHAGGELRLHQDGEVGGAGAVPDGQEGQQHQDGAGERVEEELEARIDAARAAPDADDQEHRDQHALEEHVEDDEVLGGEHAHHHRFQHQEGDHVFADADGDGFPAGQDADGREGGGEQDEQDGDAVDAHPVADAELGQPGEALLELEAGVGHVEAGPQHEADDEHDEAGPERGPAGVAGDDGVVAADGHDEGGAQQRQPGDEAEDREAGGVDDGVHGGVHQVTGRAGRR